MLRPATRRDLPAITALLARANAAPYDITRVAAEKVFGRGYRGEAHPRVYVEQNHILGIAVTCATTLRVIAVDPSHRRRGIGSLLLQDEHAAFAEPGNYFTPGVVETDAATRAFLTKHGFIEHRWTYNLAAPLPPPDDQTAAGTSPAPLRATGDERERVLAFAEGEFSPVWRFECALAPDNLFYVEAGGRIAGFSVHNANNNPLGTFGPTGVLPEFRGHGYGRALLLASLRELARGGYASAIIPWTDALDFYRKSCGAEITARFVSYVR
jgi:GNAT superfamily N-acetyltransferase